MELDYLAQKKGSFVLMPCRALEAFRPEEKAATMAYQAYVLMPCRALEAFRLMLADVSSTMAMWS